MWRSLRALTALGSVVVCRQRRIGLRGPCPATLTLLLSSAIPCIAGGWPGLVPRE
jgi:hypothetical protein